MARKSKIKTARAVREVNVNMKKLVALGIVSRREGKNTMRVIGSRMKINLMKKRRGY